MIITVAPFTGGPFSVTVNKTDSVEDLKKVVSKKLKVLKERICLLYRERYVVDVSTIMNWAPNFLCPKLCKWDCNKFGPA
jgi:hypothetical protein